jgi:hypothetical protein
MASTKAVDTNTQAVSPVSIFGGAGAAAASGAGACAAASGAYRTAPPAIMARQRRLGKIFLILLICDSIIASFHPLIQNEVANTFLKCSRPGYS